MPKLTVRGRPDELIAHIKEAARAHNRSMEQEVRAALARRYGNREAMIQRLRQRWPDLPDTDAADVRHWRGTGRR